MLVNETFNCSLENFDYGIEPIGTIYWFNRKIWNGKVLKELSDTILPEICSKLICKRQVPVVWSQPITSDDGSLLDYLQIEKDQEPADAINCFANLFLDQNFKPVCYRLQTNNLHFFQ